MLFSSKSTVVGGRASWEGKHGGNCFVFGVCYNTFPSLDWTSFMGLNIIDVGSSLLLAVIDMSDTKVSDIYKLYCKSRRYTGPLFIVNRPLWCGQWNCWGIFFWQSYFLFFLFFLFIPSFPKYWFILFFLFYLFLFFFCHGLSSAIY